MRVYSGTIPHGALVGVGVDDHHNQLHVAAHGTGQPDDIHATLDLALFTAANRQHDDLDTVTIDQHHARDHGLAEHDDLQIAVKSADQGFASQTTFQNDTHLVLPVEVNSVYLVDLYLIWQSPTAAQYKCKTLLPAAADLYGNFGECGSGGEAVRENINFFAGAGQIMMTSNGTQQYSHIRGVLRTGGTAGNLQIQFAQVNTNITNIYHRRGSTLVLRKVA